MADDNSTLNIWNCMTCRRRKIRCDRHQPCSQCSKAGLECTFPVSGRVPTRRDHGHTGISRDTKQTELLARLRRLEGLVRELSSQQNGSAWSQDAGRGSSSSTSPVRLQDAGEGLSRDLGRMIVTDTNSLYIPSQFWESLSAEVSDLRQFFEEDAQESITSDETPIDPRMPWGLVPSLGLTRSDVDNLQPLPSQMPFIWQIYCENVDHNIKILHRGTMARIIQESKGRFSSQSDAMQALLFAISLVAVASMSEQDVVDNFRDSQEALVNRLTIGLEFALSKTGVLDATDIRTVQALVIYIEVKSHDLGAKASWSLTGVLVRIALFMGLHRDGSHFDEISPFDAEMRRRLWWHICFLDSAADESQAPCSQMTMYSLSFDTKQPANVNDEDLLPDMKEPPAARSGITDTTLALIRCELWLVARKNKKSMADPGTRTTAGTAGETNSNVRREMDDVLSSARKRIQQTYLCNIQPEDSRHIFIAEFSRLALARAELAFNSHIVPPTSAPLDIAVCPAMNRIFLLSLACITSSHHLETWTATRSWYWTLGDCVPWRVISVMLVQLRQRHWGPTCERAWRALLGYTTHSTAFKSSHQKNILRFPVNKLFAAVERHRELENRRLERDPHIAGQLRLLSNKDSSDGDDWARPAYTQSDFDTTKAEATLNQESAISSGMVSETSSASLDLPQEIPGTQGAASMIGDIRIDTDLDGSELNSAWEELLLNESFAGSEGTWSSWDGLASR